MKPVIYALSGSNGRADHVALALQQGFRKHGIAAPIVTTWRGMVEGEVALAYGWNHEPVFSAYKTAGRRFVYWDLGYWNRTPDRSKGGSRNGAYRLAVDNWDTVAVMRRDCLPDRWNETGIELQPYRGINGAIMVAGMSDKAAGTHGFAPGQWERSVLSQVRELAPTVEIIFRPKDKGLKRAEPIARALQRCSLVLSHHSNVAVDALIAGVPSYCRRGVGRLWSLPSLEEAMKTRGPVISDDHRRRLLSDIAYAQWTANEMRSGHAWEHVKGLLRCA